MKITGLLLASAALIASTSIANAGYYIGVDGGIGIPMNEKITANGEKFNLEFDNGFVGDIVAGYDFGNNIRTELDFGYRHFGLDNIENVPISGSLNSYAVTANVLYDFNNSTAFTPFVGAGVGIAHNKLKDTTFDVKGSSTKFAALGTAGISYNITDCFSASLAYRFFTTLNQEFAGGKYDLRSNEFLFGIRYEFNAPAKSSTIAASSTPAASVVATSSAEPVTYAVIDGSKEYTIYFKNNSSRLGSIDKKVIAESANSFADYEDAKVKVSGYADEIGTKEYNKALSGKRANVVKNELESLGVQADEVVTYAAGAVGKGINPKNRRVDIQFIK